MPTTGKVSGNLFLVYLDGVAIACSTEASVNITNEQIEVTCKDNDGAKTYILGGQDATFTVGGIFQFDNVGADDLTDAVINQSTVSVKFGTDVVGDFYLSMSAVITSMEITAPLNNVTTYSATFTAAGPLSKLITT